MSGSEVLVGGGWSSGAVSQREGFKAYQEWGCQSITPLELETPDVDRFCASWKMRPVGTLQLLVMQAAPLRVLHDASRTRGPSMFQILMPIAGPILSQTKANGFDLKAGEFVLLSNQQPYEHRIESVHRAIDLIVPADWLARWLPDPEYFFGRPFTATQRWGLPFGQFITTLVNELDIGCLPTTVLSDQIGALFALALGHRPSGPEKHKEKLLRRIMSTIEEQYADPNIDPATIARQNAISKRYLHAILAETGTTFLGTIGALRFGRAKELLADQRFAGLPITEIAWRCGFADPNYFARVFRARFGCTPRDWRKSRSD